MFVRTFSLFSQIERVLASFPFLRGTFQNSNQKSKIAANMPARSEQVRSFSSYLRNTFPRTPTHRAGQLIIPTFVYTNYAIRCPCATAWVDSPKPDSTWSMTVYLPSPPSIHFPLIYQLSVHFFFYILLKLKYHTRVWRFYLDNNALYGNNNIYNTISH